MGPWGQSPSMTDVDPQDPTNAHGIVHEKPGQAFREPAYIVEMKLHLITALTPKGGQDGQGVRRYPAWNEDSLVADCL